MRDGRRHGFNDSALGRRYALHWAIAAAGFMLAMLPAAVGLVDVDGALPGFLLVGGLVYALAGVHLERPLLWVGVLMLAAYVVLVLLARPIRGRWPAALSRSARGGPASARMEEHTSELQSLMAISYA